MDLGPDDPAARREKARLGHTVAGADDPGQTQAAAPAVEPADPDYGSRRHPARQPDRNARAHIGGIVVPAAAMVDQVAAETTRLALERQELGQKPRLVGHEYLPAGHQRHELAVERTLVALRRHIGDPMPAK